MTSSQRVVIVAFLQSVDEGAPEMLSHVETPFSRGH